MHVEIYDLLSISDACDWLLEPGDIMMRRPRFSIPWSDDCRLWNLVVYPTLNRELSAYSDVIHIKNELVSKLQEIVPMYLSPGLGFMKQSNIKLASVWCAIGTGLLHETRL